MSWIGECHQAGQCLFPELCPLQVSSSTTSPTQREPDDKGWDVGEQEIPPGALGVESP